MKKNNKTILVLEDDHQLQEAINDKLKKRGFDVIDGKSVSEGMKSIENKKIDAVWLDHYLLGKENGIDFVMKLKEIKYNNIPVFVISNTASNDKIKEYFKLGVTKFYIKAEKSLNDIIDDIDKNIKN